MSSAFDLLSFQNLNISFWVSFVLNAVYVFTICFLYAETIFIMFNILFYIFIFIYSDIYLDNEPDLYYQENLL